MIERNDIKPNGNSKLFVLGIRGKGSINPILFSFGKNAYYFQQMMLSEYH